MQCTLTCQYILGSMLSPRPPPKELWGETKDSLLQLCGFLNPTLALSPKHSMSVGTIARPTPSSSLGRRSGSLLCRVPFGTVPSDLELQHNIHLPNLSCYVSHIFILCISDSCAIKTIMNDLHKYTEAQQAILVPKVRAKECPPSFTTAPPLHAC